MYRPLACYARDWSSILEVGRKKCVFKWYFSLSVKVVLRKKIVPPYAEMVF